MNKPYSGGSADPTTPTWDIFLAHASTALSHAEHLYDLLKDQCRFFLGKRIRVVSIQNTNIHLSLVQKKLEPR
jgi:hypothetical protein